MRYTAVVQDSSKRRSALTLEISGRDAHGAFDWACKNKGLKRVGRIKEHTSATSELTEISARKFESHSEAIQKVG